MFPPMKKAKARMEPVRKICGNFIKGLIVIAIVGKAERVLSSCTTTTRYNSCNPIIKRSRHECLFAISRVSCNGYFGLVHFQSNVQVIHRSHSSPSSSHQCRKIEVRIQLCVVLCVIFTVRTSISEADVAAAKCDFSPTTMVPLGHKHRKWSLTRRNQQFYS